MAHNPNGPVESLRGKRVTVVGLGIEGIDLVHYLSAQGARVTVSDTRPADRLHEAAEAVERDEPALSLGGDQTRDIEHAEAIFVSQGVPWRLPALEDARRRGVPVSSMTRLFFERCPAPVAGITGSAGKTTTTALVGAMLESAGEDYIVGGNIGVGLLGLLDRIDAQTKVVVELSHTQLESVESSPHVACVTNVTPNHLDEFSWNDYVDLKRRIFRFQRPDDVAIFNLDDDVCTGFARDAPGGAAYTAVRRPLPGDGVTIEGGAVVRHDGGETFAVLPRDEIRLRGDHNVANVLSAVAVGARLGVPDESAADAIRGFQGLPHRLEPVASVNDVLFVNDSIATTPERTLAGLRSFAEPLVLLLGGRDKRLPLGALAAEAAARCRAVVTFGEAGALYASAVREAATGDRPAVERVDDVTAAVTAATRLARPGDVVLLSPAGTSFDAYPNFERRGAGFREAVQALAGDA